MVEFTIVTPGFRQLDWLACCIASVADQEGVTIEHIVQDAGTVGFSDFVEKMRKRWPDREGYRRIMISESDAGMYDAINKGLKRGSGRICAYLNCDEQYLPGALAQVRDEFTRHPKAEILFGGFLVVDAQGRLVTAQKPVRMFWPHVATSHLPNFTCATFFRRSLLEGNTAWFDPSYRACGDAAWMIARLRARTPSRKIPKYLAAFTEQTASQGLSELGTEEAIRLRKAQPLWVQKLGGLWKLAHWGLKVFSGHYFPSSVSSGIYPYGQAAGPRQPMRGLVWPFWPARLCGPTGRS